MDDKRWQERFIVRFWSRVNKAADGCWAWTGALYDTGYGQVWVRDRPGLAHRVSYELAVGPIPAGLSIDHLCRNRICVRPDHLEAVTPAENNHREDASITHCPRGHLYDDANIGRFGKRRGLQCRECMRQRSRAYWHTTRKFRKASR